MTTAPATTESARRQAEVAADAAVVRVMAVEDASRLREVAALFARVWASKPGAGPLPSDALRACTHAGGVVHAALTSDGVVGASAAIWGPPDARDVYSLIAGADRTCRGVGYALKLAQRAWALERGAATISWTFDPLIRRNAWFNLGKLGAHAPEYLVDFYGPLEDAFNAGDETDRLTVQWPLARFDPDHVPGFEPRPEPSLEPGPDGLPFKARGRDAVWCRIPEDILALRAGDPAQARAWRHAVRAVFLAAHPLAATSISRDGWYHLTPLV
ncbi:GNAT family N-acetyltransferase [Actinocorallia sp. API 0066]|uniref:GNAT family N-acetyltransferase n=1 Tax=Actinocorallia sp. API 0066 TaxID=2896846 RepID=UPI001E2AD900|nr:GNAT family N-acetyltransferase [Actinocorallia sp. API 0066]MCD0448001.1 GNAT family N-acetyltransferase [Actinocorallia sp. API 0066]